MKLFILFLIFMILVLIRFLLVLNTKCNLQKDRIKVLKCTVKDLIRQNKTLDYDNQSRI